MALYLELRCGMVTDSKTRSVHSLLLVEDDPVILEIQVTILRKKFSEVVFHSAVNGRLGLELFRSLSPDIVITDINMAEMCGVEMSHCIRAIKPDTKFIALTGKSPDEIGFEFDHYILKPVLFQDLFATIEQCIGEIAQPGSKPACSAG